MRKINLNPLIKKSSKIMYYEKDNYYYVAIDGLIIIRFDVYDFFTAVSERKIKEQKEENERIYTLYNEIISNKGIEDIKDTTYQKNMFEDEYKIFKTPNHYKYVNTKFTNLLNDSLYEYDLLSTDSPVSPVYARHQKEKISFVLMPTRVNKENFEFVLKED